MRRLRSSYVAQHLAHLGRTLSGLLGGAGILTAIGIIQLIRGAHSLSVWFWLFCAAMLVAVAEAIAVHRDLHAGPQLRFAGIDAADASTIGTAVVPATGVSAHVVLGPPNRFVRVYIVNDPGDRIGECAERVAATITFLDDSDKPLMAPMLGRWAETPQRLETGRIGLSLDEVQLDIEANGVPHSLDIAMKVPGEAEFYAYNHENSNVRDLRLESHRLNVAECRVSIRVRPANGRPIKGMFLLRNDGDTPSLTQTD